jgi:hypothetical protein
LVPIIIKFFVSHVQKFKWLAKIMSYAKEHSGHLNIDAKRLTWSSHINQIRKKAAQRIGALGPLLHRSGLSTRNGVLLYKQLIRPMLDYGCPVWRSAARSHVRRLQVIQSKCLRAATGAPWYISNRQIHEDLGVPFLADHIRSLTESFDSKLAGAGTS